ncbi:uncharacterized protein [Aquarana catesbeiana]|uniref:uncharacterized protein isoform X1 n=1 Tax=Aquarana catesbeiana TaxID=8400 RepID=UPI003CCA0EBE
MSAASENLLEHIKRYVPGIRADNSEHGIERLIILLLGFAGHGKSSLINSCMCVVKDEIYRNLAGAGADEGGKTMKRTSHHLTDTIRITDNRGFKKMEPGEILTVCAQQRNLRLEGDVEWEGDNLQETIRCIPLVNKHPKEIILPVIVHSCLYNLKVDEENSMKKLINKCQEITGQLRSLGEVTWSEKNLIESIRQFKQQEGTRQEDFLVPVFVYSCYREWNCMEGDEIKKIFTSVHQITGIQPIVVITRCSSGNWKKIEAKFVEFGCTRIVAMENYTENNGTRTRETDENVLKLLTMCIEEAETGIGKLAKQDPSRRPIKMMMGQIDQDLELLRKTKLKYETF